MTSDTIAAIATAPGRGGVGIVRVSGPNCCQIAEKLLKRLPTVREATYTPFYSLEDNILDQGIALYFQAPHSFTGEDVLELQAHGGPVLLDMLLDNVIHCGARLALPGEFSERAFLNDKLDLAQAEAIADLIDASSQQAAKQAINSLKGEFSTQINALVDILIELRMYVESAIDFPEEEIDFLSDGKVLADLSAIIAKTEQVQSQAQQGVLLREGMKVVIAGRPNAGKSSLLNALAQREVAIVTDIEGTTRDVLREHIQIDGMPLHIIDTAGLRESPDKVEQLGIERAWQEIEQADRVLLMIDATQNISVEDENYWQLFQQHCSSKITVLFNKIDETNAKIAEKNKIKPYIEISALTGTGLHQLREHLKQVMGYSQTNEGSFSARRRHLQALEKAHHYLLNGLHQLENFAAGELLAEDLRLAQEHLSEITGRFTPDDLLGKIFSSFCIGK
ncbi:tRNA modification GTPase trmE [Alteromonadaceae bacterium Bs31]|nr:tRNA modification GTPase trmE [Alteromonadaceae bacterium Bs31]